MAKVVHLVLHFSGKMARRPWALIPFGCSSSSKVDGNSRDSDPEYGGLDKGSKCRRMLTRALFCRQTGAVNLRERGRLLGVVSTADQILLDGCSRVEM